VRHLEISGALYEYVVAMGTRETREQRELRAETGRLPMGGMQIGADQAALLQALVRILRAKRCLEIGTFTGYSALSVALALPEDGKIVCCDVSEEWTSIARRYWKKAGVEAKIDLRIAPALETLAKLKGKYDFAFIDADKPSYWKYYERCLELLREGGLVAVDNTLWGGSVIQRGDRSESTVALREFNERVAQDRRVDIALVPIGDGLTLAVKR
jgi:predicted O-methyltransferase YrrM